MEKNEIAVAWLYCITIKPFAAFQKFVKLRDRFGAARRRQNVRERVKISSCLSNSDSGGDGGFSTGAVFLVKVSGVDIVVSRISSHV